VLSRAFAVQGVFRRASLALLSASPMRVSISQALVTTTDELLRARKCGGLFVKRMVNVGEGN
jgi:hypothetical protein